MREYCSRRWPFSRRTFAQLGASEVLPSQRGEKKGLQGQCELRKLEQGNFSRPSQQDADLSMVSPDVSSC